MKRTYQGFRLLVVKWGMLLLSEILRDGIILLYIEVASLVKRSSFGGETQVIQQDFKIK